MIFLNDEEISLNDCLKDVESFDLFCDNKRTHVSKNDSQFDEIKNKIEDLFYMSRLMPAFGVSLHDEALKALNYDDWLQINFSKEQNENGLPFDSLLFKLEETQGFNLIRLYKDEYEGRCLYLDLNKQTDLLNLLKKTD